MANEWQNRLEARIAAIPSRARDAGAFLGKAGSWLRRYRGGMPIGFLAAIAQWESGGKMDSPGDESLGEAGYFQIAKNTPGHFGFSADLRFQAEWNIFFGALEYNVEAVKMALHHPLVRLGSADSWRLARLAFAIGSAGTKKLIDLAKPRFPGAVFAAVRDYVDAGGAVGLGSQSADKVWYRVKAVDVQWAIAERVGLGSYGLPQKPPAPNGRDYKLSPELEARMRTNVVAEVVGTLATAAAIVLA